MVLGWILCVYLFSLYLAYGQMCFYSRTFNLDLFKTKKKTEYNNNNY